MSGFLGIFRENLRKNEESFAFIGGKHPEAKVGEVSCDPGWLVYLMEASGKYHFKQPSAHARIKLSGDEPLVS